MNYVSRFLVSLGSFIILSTVSPICPEYRAYAPKIAQKIITSSKPAFPYAVIYSDSCGVLYEGIDFIYPDEKYMRRFPEPLFMPQARADADEAIRNGFGIDPNGIDIEEYESCEKEEKEETLKPPVAN